jgi:hypothetical protein
VKVEKPDIAFVLKKPVIKERAADVTIPWLVK